MMNDQGNYQELHKGNSNDTQGLSVIICSISPERAESVGKNIAETAGIDTEVIIIDNRERKEPIARIYNEGAGKAKFPYLLFIHEDTRFLGVNWGNIIISKLAEEKTGAIGFAGSELRIDTLSACGWGSLEEYNILNYIQGEDDEIYHGTLIESYKRYRTSHCEGNDFVATVTLDGMAIFARKNLWEISPFDETFLTGFHCYDIDFALSLHHKGYINYVCTSASVLFLHTSNGSFSPDWFLTTARIHEGKWCKMLPASVKDKESYKIDWEKYPRWEHFRFLKKALKQKKLPKQDVDRLIEEYFKKFGFNLKEYLKLKYKYFWYRKLRKQMKRF